MCLGLCVCVHLCACSCTGSCVCVHMYAFTCGDQRTALRFIPRNIMHLLWNTISHCLGTQQVFLMFWPVCHRDFFFSASLTLELQVCTTVLCSTRLYGSGCSNSGPHACVANTYGLRPLFHLWRTILIRFVKMSVMQSDTTPFMLVCNRGLHRRHCYVCKQLDGANSRWP